MGAKQTAANEFANGLLRLVFQNDATNAATTALGSGLLASGTAGSLYVSLHTSSPTATGNQSSFEATYPSYQRVAIARSTSAWTVTANSVSPNATIVFPTSTGSPSETETYFGIGTASTGNGHLCYFGSISPTITVNASGISPEIVGVGSIISEN